MSSVRFGYDWGRGNFKVAGALGVAWLPSHVALGAERLHSSGYGLKVLQPQYDIQFQRGDEDFHFFVGKNAPMVGTAVEGLDVSDYEGAMEQRALLYAALTEYINHFNSVTPTTPLKVVVGVPSIVLTGRDAKTRQTAIRQWLQAEHSWVVRDTVGREKSYTITVEKAGVAPQALGAMYYYMMNPDLSYRNEQFNALVQKPLGIISLGSSTVELMGIRVRQEGKSRKPELVPALEGSFSLGAYNLLNMDGKSGVWSLGYRDQEFRENPQSYATPLQSWLRQVQGLVNQKWTAQMHRDFAAVFVVGGMLKVDKVREWARKQFPNAVLAGYDMGTEDDAITAIAQGLYRQVATLP